MNIMPVATTEFLDNVNLDIDHFNNMINLKVSLEDLSSSYGSDDQFISHVFSIFKKIGDDFDRKGTPQQNIVAIADGFALINVINFSKEDITKAYQLSQQTTRKTIELIFIEESKNTEILNLYLPEKESAFENSKNKAGKIINEIGDRISKNCSDAFLKIFKSTYKNL